MRPSSKLPSSKRHLISKRAMSRSRLKWHPQRKKKNILDLYGVLGNGEQNNEDFNAIREEAKKAYYKWKESEGKI